MTTATADVQTRRVVFVLGDSPWPPTSGGQIRNAQLHRALGASGDVRAIVFRMRDPIRPDTLPERTTVVERPLPPAGRGRIALRARGLLRRRHPFLQHLVETGAPAALSQMLAKEPADVVVLTYPCFGHFVDVARLAGARVIVDIGEARRPIARGRLVSSRRPGVAVRALADLFVASGMEKSVAAADETWVASSAEKRWLPDASVRRLRVVPNTIEVDSYIRRPVPQKLPESVGFVGSFDYPPNALAADRLVHGILPLLRATRPEARAIVIGRRPPPALVRESRLATAWELRPDVADPMADLAEAGILLVPLTAGGGTKYKILEAAASGIPIITTRLGLQGLEFTDDVDLLVADTDEELAAAAIKLWADPRRAAALADHAFTRVHASYGPAALDAIVAASLDAVLGRPRR